MKRTLIFKATDFVKSRAPIRRVYRELFSIAARMVRR
jgi:hypothetical protein